MGRPVPRAVLASRVLPRKLLLGDPRFYLYFYGGREVSLSSVSPAVCARSSVVLPTLQASESAAMAMSGPSSPWARESLNSRRRMGLHEKPTASPLPRLKQLVRAPSGYSLVWCRYSRRGAEHPLVADSVKLARGVAMPSWTTHACRRQHHFEQIKSDYSSIPNRTRVSIVLTEAVAFGTTAATGDR